MTWRSVLADLRRQLLRGSGLAPAMLLAACGGSTGGSPDTAGVTTDPSGDGSSIDDGSDELTTGASSTSGMPGTTGTDPDPSTSSEGPDPNESDDDEGDESPKLDLPAKLDLPSPPDPPLLDCTVAVASASTLDEHPECPIVIEDPICTDLLWGCVALVEGESCESQCPEGNCVFDWSSCEGHWVSAIPDEICGPYQVDGECCSIASVFNLCGTDGRPFVVGGVSRQARLIRRGPSPRIHALPEPLRARLAAHWTAIARAEHASIASFARFGARLLALDAPAAMVREALAAANDEVRHAQIALAYASALEGRALEFGPLDTRACTRPDESFEATVLACVREGCIGETLAVVELRAAALGCGREELAAILHRIADDEARHAALAWRFVAWALDRSPSLAPRIAAQLEAHVIPEPEPDSPSSAERELLRAHGCLIGQQLADVRRDGVDELLRPCMAALLGGEALAPACRVRKVARPSSPCAAS